MKRRAMLGFLFALATVSGGCATSTMLDNEIVCAEKGKIRVISLYGPIGIASKIDSSPIKCPVNSEGVTK